jgi:5-methylcytosine-specific restriction protein B
LTETYNPNYGGNRSRCVGTDSRNLPCLEKFLIEVNRLYREAGIESTAELAFLLNRRRNDEKRCLEGGRMDGTPRTQNSQETPRGERVNYSLNTVLYGPPGTGKTYAAKRKAVEIVTQRKDEPEREFKKLLFSSKDRTDWRIIFTTFHPSVSYETFIEGIWAETDGSGGIRYRVKDGIFKIAAYHALWHALKEEVKEIEQVRNYEELKRTVQKYLKEHFKGNSYFDFENAENVVVIIDEINRGNVPSIFGELIALIEDAKRLGERDEIQSVLPYSNETFSVPKNLYVIGTMNTADRSIVLLDAALRRRFSFEELLPEEEALNGVEVGGLNVKSFLSKLNREIKRTKGKDFVVGHTYFLPLKELPEEDRKKEFIKILSRKILPLLQEYFYDDWETLIQILGRNRRNEEVERTLINRFGEISCTERSSAEQVIALLKDFTTNDSGE